jgi:ATP-dependent transcriptional regulator
MYERGDVSGAEITVLDALDLIEGTAFHEGFLQAFLVLVRAAVARGDTQRAIGLLNRAERLSWERGWNRVVAILLVERTRLILGEGNFQEAHSLLQAFQQLKVQHATSRLCSNAEIGIQNTIAKGLVASATGHSADAVDLLRAAYDALLQAENRLAALHIGLDLAVALSRNGLGAKSITFFRELLNEAAKANVSTLFTERKADVAQILASAKALGISVGDSGLPTYAQVRGSMEEAGDKEFPASRASQGITKRERSILGFIAAGQSNKEIARELGVAPETVKTHVKRIFQKLSAETRAQAVVRAQSLGMLESVGRTPAHVAFKQATAN